MITMLGKVECYIIGSISLSIDQSIISWVVEMHVCVVVLNVSQQGDLGEPTGWIASGSHMTRMSWRFWRSGSDLKLDWKSKVESKVKIGCWDAESEWSGKVWFMTTSLIFELQRAQESEEDFILLAKRSGDIEGTSYVRWDRAWGLYMTYEQQDN